MPHEKVLHHYEYMNSKTTRNTILSIKSARGVALLPLVFVFAGLVVTVALAFSAISIAQGIAVESEFGASRALHYAEAGLSDALMRLARDRDYRCDTADCYTLPFAENGCVQNIACAYVTIEDGATENTLRIVARGIANTNVRILERIATFDAENTGAHTLTTWCEQAGSVCPE